MTHRVASVVAKLLMVWASVGLVSAQEFPPRQIKIVVPFPPGGPTDTLARHLAHGLNERLNVPVLVDNRAGASGMIGSEFVSHAEPDGTTLLFNATHHVTNPVFYRKLPYDTQNAFTPIALVASVPNALVVNSKIPINSVSEVITIEKQKPGTLTIATFGGSSQLSVDLFNSMAGIKIVQVPYKGSAPVMSDVVAGHVPMTINSLPTILPHVQSGALRVLGVTSSERVHILPEVPTIAEAGGMAGYEAVAWFGIFMPATSNESLKEHLSSAVTDVLRSNETRTRFAALGAEPGKLVGDAFRGFVNAELIKWAEVGKRAGIEPQ